VVVDFYLNLGWGLVGKEWNMVFGAEKCVGNGKLLGVRLALVGLVSWMIGGATLPLAAAVQDPMVGQFSESPWSLEIVLSDSEFAALEPAPAPGFGGPVPGGGPGGNLGGNPANRAINSDRETVANVLGVQFPWVEGEMVLRGASTPDAAPEEATVKSRPCRVRYDGDFSYLFSASGPKRPLYLETREPVGEVSGAVGALGSAFKFHNLQFDPTMVRERVAVGVANMLQVPAPRIAHVEISLRVGQAEPRYLGLYTMLEAIDDAFLQRNKIDSDAVRLQTNGLGSLQYLGEEWTPYESLFRASRPLSPAEKKRVIEFCKLVSQSSEAEFSERLGEFVDPESLARYLAFQVLVSNVTGFSTIGTNDIMCLDAKTGRFTMVAAEIETALGGAALSGTAEQLADLDWVQPYAGPLPLLEKWMRVPDLKNKSGSILKAALDGGFGERAMVDSIQRLLDATAPHRQRDSEAAAARLRQSGGGAGFGPPPGGPPPMDAASFVQRRRVSILRQLQGEAGFKPAAPNFGGGGNRQNAEAAISSDVFQQSVSTPDGFQATLFGKSPVLNYPVAIAAEPAGAVYVGIDEQGSLGTTPGGGRVVRAVDRDQDGVMDDFTVFCRVDHVRGVAFRAGKLWVSHPPFLSMFEDTDDDGVADRQTQLVGGLTTNLVDERGGDHTTNFVRLGIDGWLYIGAGDYGVPNAVGVDGSTVTLRGGGILRVRPDGTELELFATGLRNPFDMAIDPFLNMFTRDNTNDGGGWDTRVSQLFDSAEYGYPRLFANFSDEIMPTLGTYGGGGGTGGLYVEDPDWPERWNRSLFTGDWGRSAVFHHPLQSRAATFAITQESFVEIPRATGMDLDALGNLYIASWWSGEASVYVGPHVGFVTRVAPTTQNPREFPQLQALDVPELIKLLGESQSVVRFHAQGELLRRGPNEQSSQLMQATMVDKSFPLAGRVAALFALKQLEGTESHPFLIRCLEDDSIREFAIRALADRRTQLAGVNAALLLPYLNDANPRVVAQTVIGLGRIGDPAAAPWLLPVGDSQTVERPDPAQPNEQAVIPHLAIQALVRLQATDACLAGLNTQHWRAALQALRQFHNSTAVDGLIRSLSQERDLQKQTAIVRTLIRLYQHETPYDGSWWGIRPDTTGPYYDPMTWSESEKIQSVVRSAIEFAAPETRAALIAELKRHRIRWEGLPTESDADTIEASEPIVIQPVDPNNPEQIGNWSYAQSVQRVLDAKGNVARGQVLFRERSCSSCHTATSGQTPVGPHLADIGKRYKAEELLESVLKPSEKIAQGYETQLFLLTNGEVVTGFVISETGRQIVVRDSQGKTDKITRDEIDERSRQAVSAMPEGLVGSLRATELADLLAYLQSL
jgi:putative heme-binding domain-containing protein